ncbi:MAG: hypothetical protein HQ546_05750, partial [Planctomycetes bacterium]|nr:hypothetical protein [Planctomycetota bacterium]
MRVIWRAVSVSLAGSPSWGSQRELPTLQPSQLRWGVNGTLSALLLKCCLGQGPTQGSFLRADDTVAWPNTGDEIRLIEGYGSCSEWFAGHIAQESLLIQSSPDTEARSYVAYGPEIRLQGTSVHGQWCKTSEADDMEIAGTLTAENAVPDNVLLTDHPTIFNEGGKPNASQEVDLDESGDGWVLTSRDDPPGREARVFEPPGRVVRKSGSSTPAIQAAYWTAYTALRSLVEYIDDYTIISPKTDWAALKGLLDNTVLGQVVIEGANLLEAIRAILLPIGFGFCLAPWHDGDTYEDGLTRHSLYVFSLHPDTEYGLAPILADDTAGAVAITDTAGQQAEVQRLEFLRDSHNVQNNVQVIGDVERVQVCLTFDDNAETRDLHPAWDTTEHNLATWAQNGVIPEMDDAQYTGEDPPNPQDFINKYGRIGQGNLQYVDVFRTFVWNEDAAYRPHVTTEPDLTNYFGAGEYTRRPRPIGPTLIRATSATASGVLPAYVEIGIVGDD